MADRPDEIPVDKVKTMRTQGISDDKIVDSLQKDGYLSSQIFDAMTQADMKPAKEVKEVTDNFPDVVGNVQGKEPTPPPRRHTGFEGTEELVESIIDEKWQEIEKNVQKVVEWKNDTQKVISGLQNDIQNLDERFDKLHQAVIGKIGEYDKNILNVGAEIKAMEKAFSKIIPEFADSVTELTELVDELKEGKEKKEDDKNKE